MTPIGSSEAFRQGLRELGYIEGKNILVEYRYAEGKQDRFPSLVAELLQLKVDVLVSATSIGDPRGQAGDQDDPHCHGDYCRSGRDRDNRELGASWRKYHGSHQTHARPKRKTVGIAKGSGSKISRVGVLLDADVHDDYGF